MRSACLPGVDAFIAAFPAYEHWRLLFVVAFIIVVLLLNLRGVSETSKWLLVPVYSFIVVIIGLVIISFFHWQDVPAVSTQTASSLSLLVMIKAFAVGCSALTGVEAISNSVQSFKQPAAHNARQTLLYLGLLLAFLFSAFMVLATHFHIAPAANTTVLASLAEHVVGRNAYYFIIQTATICILLLAANTSFAAFPQLLATLAKDGYAPRIFLNRGDRLGYSNSMIFLAAAAIVASICFQGNTETLIPLYALGVFIPFTMALFALAYDVRGREKLVPFLAGLLTSVVVITLLLTKTMYIWPLALFVPAMMYVLLRIHSHYEAVAASLRQHYEGKAPVGQLYVLPINGVYATTEKAIAALQLQHAHCIALYVATSDENCRHMKEQWARLAPTIRLVTYHSSKQKLLQPLLRGIHKLQVVAAHEQLQLHVVVPQLVVEKRWQALLHNHHAFALKQALLHERNIVVTTVPFQVDR